MIVFQIDMESFFGDICTVYAFFDATASVDFCDPETGKQKTKVFASYDDAYNWAYRKGFRE